MTEAHGYVGREEMAGAWSFEPAVVAAIALAGLLFALGLRRMPRGVGAGRALAFVAALVALATALVSPVDALAETLFSAHMLQHLLLMLVVAPLLVRAEPFAPMLVALPRRARKAVARLRRNRAAKLAARAGDNPLLVGAVYAAVLWSWHLPDLYESALRSDAVHAAEHATFLAASLAFWRLVIPTTRWRVPPASALLLVFVTGLHSAALGAVLTFASEPLYRIHVAGARLWGVAPLADQQLAGVTMWVPMGALYLLAMARLLLHLLRDLDRRLPATAAATGNERR